MTTTGLRPSAALAMLVLICAGCSSAPVGTAAVSGNATYEKAAAFAACMRQNGVTGFPDPDASGAVTIDDIVNNSSLDTNSSAWKQAISACKDLQPPGFTGARRTPEQQKAALIFARCIRDNGVQDFPDPDPDGPLVDTNRIPSLAGKGARSMPELDAAIRTCTGGVAGQLGLVGR